MTRMGSAREFSAARGARALFSLREPADFHEPIPVSERLVQAIWADQLFHTERLFDRDGRSIRVLSPGRWNVEGGPDFTDARLEIGGVLRRGDVEIHLHATGWDEHGHEADPAYARVILDVCLWSSEAVPRLTRYGGRAVAQIVLSPHLEGSLGELAESLDPDSYPIAPMRLRRSLSPFDHLAPDKKLARIEAAGRFRFERKSQRLEVRSAAVGPEQAAWEALAEALGYKHNRWIFRRLAAAVPVASMLRLTDDDQRIAALLAAARAVPLRVHQVRPANHPERRLAALALLLSRRSRIEEWLAALAAQPERLRRPPAIEHAFWSRHYRAGGARLARPVALIGPERWREMAINVVLPFAHARAAETARARLQTLWADWPAPAPNRLCREMAYDLGIPPPRRNILQQGLVQLRLDGDLLAPSNAS